MLNFDEVLNASTEYFEGDALSANVFVTKYALCDKAGKYHESTPDDMHHRLSREFHRIESK